MSLKVAADSTITPDPATAWNRRLAEARAAADRADNGLDAAVCDAARAGISPDAIADALDFELDDVMQTIQDDEHGQDPENDHTVDQPPLQPVIFLRGRDVPNQTWKELKQLLWARGLATIANRTAAAHLARGGTPVVFLDFSNRSLDNLKVAGVRGVYREDTLTVELINGGAVTTPRRNDDSIDVDRVVLLVHQVIGDLPAVNERRMLAAQAASGEKERR